MINIDEHKQDPIFHALQRLDEAMQERDLPPLELNVVGGFALMLHGCRDPKAYTDIDYVGFKLSKEVKTLSEDIGREEGMVKDWLNNELLLSGTTFEDLQFTTGELKFEPAYSMRKISVNLIDERDLLKLKLLAIDTSLVELENHQDFTRTKDLPDIKMLLEKLDMTPEEAVEQNQEFLVNEYTAPFIQLYIDNGGDIATTLEQLQKQIDRADFNRLKALYEDESYDETDSLLDDRGVRGMLDDLFSH